jgi:hypothetical protein
MKITWGYVLRLQYIVSFDFKLCFLCAWSLVWQVDTKLPGVRQRDLRYAVKENFVYLALTKLRFLFWKFDIINSIYSIALIHHFRHHSLALITHSRKEEILAP